MSLGCTILTHAPRLPTLSRLRPYDVPRSFDSITGAHIRRIQAPTRCYALVSDQWGQLFTVVGCRRYV